MGLVNYSPSVYGDLLVRLFAQFDAADICYCVLRSFEELPRRVDGDIDILVRLEDLPLAETVIKSLTGDSCLRRERDGHLLFDVISGDETKCAVRENRPAEKVVLDIQVRLQWMGMDYMDAAAVLASRERYGEIFVAGLKHQAAGIVCHVILDKGYIKSGYKKIILEAQFRYGNATLTPLIPFLGNSTVSRLCSALLARDDEQILRTRMSLIRALLLGKRRSIPSCISFLRKRYVRMARAVLFPPGVLVATAGPDGSGKSTLIERAGLVLSNMFQPVEERYMGWNQFVLPTKPLLRVAQKTLARGALKKVATDSSDSQVSSSSWTYNFSVLHYFVDLWARYLIQIRPILSRGGLVLCDRYFYDVLVRDVWICKSRRVRSLLLALTPRPTVTTLLTGDPGMIAARKREISPSETARQLAKFASHKQSFQGVLELDATGPLETNTIDVVEAVLRSRAREDIT